MRGKIVPLRKPGAGEPCPVCGRKGHGQATEGTKAAAWALARVGWFGITGGVLIVYLIGAVWMLREPPAGAGDFFDRVLALALLAACSLVFLKGLFGRLKVDTRPPGQHVYHHYDTQDVHHRERR